MLIPQLEDLASIPQLEDSVLIQPLEALLLDWEAASPPWLPPARAATGAGRLRVKPTAVRTSVSHRAPLVWSSQDAVHPFVQLALLRGASSHQGPVLTTGLVAASTSAASTGVLASTCVRLLSASDADMIGNILSILDSISVFCTGWINIALYRSITIHQSM